VVSVKRLWRYPYEHPSAFPDELEEAVTYVTRIRFASLPDDGQADGVRMLGYRLIRWAEEQES